MSGWQNDIPDSYTVPASVPIGGDQDGVILSGKDIPQEMRDVNITAAILFQRGDYPSEGPTTPEYKLYFAGLARIGFPIVKKGLVFGALRDNKDGTNTTVLLQSFPLVLDADPWPLAATSAIQFYQQLYLEDGGATKVPLGMETGFASASVGGWYDIPLTAPWSGASFPNYYDGLRWTIDAAGTAHIQGVIQTSAPGPNSFIANLRDEVPAGANLPVTCDRNLTFVGTTPGAVVDFVIDISGGLFQAGVVGFPAANTPIFVAFTYKVTEEP